VQPTRIGDSSPSRARNRVYATGSYEAYIASGLDGSGFDPIDGIRGGRIKERPSLNEPAAFARLDYYPFAERAVLGQTLRLGLAAYDGGLDNGNKGANPGIDASVTIGALDFEYSVGPFDFKGAGALVDIDGSRSLPAGTASEIRGWYLEAAWRFLPSSRKAGKLSRADFALFVRYDDIDTQHEMPAGGPAPDPAGDRTEWTVGVSLLLTPSFVVKADYQIRDDATTTDVPDAFNLGIGWQF
jgi:hypothetical protein